MKLEDYKVIFRDWPFHRPPTPDSTIHYYRLTPDNQGIELRTPNEPVHQILCWLMDPRTHRAVSEPYSPEVIEQLVALCKLRFDL